MAHSYTGQATPEQRATLALWTLPGVGAEGIAKLCLTLGPLEALLERAPETWWDQLKSDASERASALERLKAAGSLERLARQAEAHLEATGIRAAFPGDPFYPRGLFGIPGQPPVIFARGAAPGEYPTLAMVGSRRVDASSCHGARQWARAIAEHGVCVVSGAAEGIDQACHQGALEAGGRTWAFVGSALDQLDASQARIGDAILAGGGTLFSELPPGVRASKKFFPRRNRLIAGASNAVLVVRGVVPTDPERTSGVEHTVDAAKKQGRKVLAVPGEPRNAYAVLCNKLILEERATLCMGVEQAVKAAGGVAASRGALAPAAPQIDLTTLSPAAQRAYAVLQRVPQDFDDVLIATGDDPAQVASALTELELSGLAIQHPGKLYERM